MANPMMTHTKADPSCSGAICTLTNFPASYISGFDSATGIVTFSTSDAGLDGTSVLHKITCTDAAGTNNPDSMQMDSFTVTFNDPGPDCSAAVVTMANDIPNGEYLIAAPGKID